MQRLPGILRNHQPYLPVYPLAFSRLDLRGYDLVVSSSSAFAKNVYPPAGAPHICYCHSPMRFAWNAADYARRERLRAAKRVARWPFLRGCELGYARHSAGGSLDRELDNRGGTYHAVLRAGGGRHPPPGPHRRASATSDTPRITTWSLTRLVPYKRLDIVVEAFNRLGKPLGLPGVGAIGQP